MGTLTQHLLATPGSTRATMGGPRGERYPRVQLVGLRVGRRLVALVIQWVCMMGEQTGGAQARLGVGVGVGVGVV